MPNSFAVTFSVVGNRAVHSVLKVCENFSQVNKKSFYIPFTFYIERGGSLKKKCWKLISKTGYRLLKREIVKSGMNDLFQSQKSLKKKLNLLEECNRWLGQLQSSRRAKPDFLGIHEKRYFKEWNKVMMLYPYGQNYVVKNCLHRWRLPAFSSADVKSHQLRNCRCEQ